MVCCLQKYAKLRQQAIHETGYLYSCFAKGRKKELRALLQKISCHLVALGNAKLRGASQLLRLAVYCLSPGIEYFEQKEARTYGNAPREKVGTGHAVYLGKKSFHLFALGIGGGMRERIVVIALFLGRTERKPAKLRIVGAHTLQNGIVIGKEQYIS